MYYLTIYFHQEGTYICTPPFVNLYSSEYNSDILDPVGMKNKKELITSPYNLVIK